MGFGDEATLLLGHARRARPIDESTFRRRRQSAAWPIAAK
jgi:hypothetical protein